MEYTIQKLGHLAGVTNRTLRYYDDIGLLKPAKINSSGYRIYGQFEIDRLQQILFFRELGVSLDLIGNILSNPAFDGTAELKIHRIKLLEKRQQLDVLIDNLDKTIVEKERGETMTNHEKFQGFKRKMIEDNEIKYGNEIREKYGNETVDEFNKKITDMTKDQLTEAEKLSSEIASVLAEAFQTGNPGGTLAQEAADLHRKWLCCYMDSYSKELHAGLAQMYVADERFTAYYDKMQPGTTVFLRDAILIYTGVKES